MTIYIQTRNATLSYNGAHKLRLSINRQRMLVFACIAVTVIAIAVELYQRGI